MGYVIIHFVTISIPLTHPGMTQIVHNCPLYIVHYFSTFSYLVYFRHFCSFKQKSKFLGIFLGIFQHFGNISTFWKNFQHFWKNFNIFVKISTFWKNFNFLEKFQLFGKISTFWKNFNFLEK